MLAYPLRQETVLKCSRKYPLSFVEFLSACEGAENTAFLEYMYYGGLPQILKQSSSEKKAAFLQKLYKTVYLKDIYERHEIEHPAESEELVKVLSFNIASAEIIGV